MKTVSLVTLRCAWRYTFRTFGRRVNIQGSTYAVDADSLRDAIRRVRQCVSRAWSLELAKSERL